MYENLLATHVGGGEEIFARNQSAAPRRSRRRQRNTPPLNLNLYRTYSMSQEFRNVRSICEAGNDFYFLTFGYLKSYDKMHILERKKIEI